MVGAAWLLPFLIVGFACEQRTPTTPTSGTAPIIQMPEADPLPLTFTMTRCGRFRAGTYASLACSIVIEPGTKPGSTGIRVLADLRSLGGRNGWEIGRCVACGGPEFDLDLHVPADLSSGPKVIPLTASDDQGRTASGSATIEVLPAAAGVARQR
jgi:hypothetical protein